MVTFTTYFMSLAKNSVIYLCSNIINAAIPFLLLPILTRYLTPSEYGQIAMFQILIVGLSAFVGLNTVGAASRYFYDNNNEKDIAIFNSSCIQILIISSLFLFIFGFIFLDKLVSYLSIPKEWIFGGILFSFSSFLLNLRLGQWQVRGIAIKFGSLQISNSAINMLLSLLFVVVFHYGAEGRVSAQIIAGIIAAFIAVSLLYKDKLVYLYVWNLEHIKQALFFGVPLIPHVFGGFLLLSVDRFVINQKLGLSSAGIYMVAVQLSMALMVVFDAINKAYIPWLYGCLSENSDKQKGLIVKYTYAYYAFLLVVSIIPFLIGPWILIFIAGDEYKASGDIIGWLCLGQIFGGMYLMVTNYVFYAKRTMLLSWVTISAGVLNIILVFLLIEPLGIKGAAIAFVLSKFIQFLMTWYIATRSVKMPWFYKIG